MIDNSERDKEVGRDGRNRISQRTSSKQDIIYHPKNKKLFINIDLNNYNLTTGGRIGEYKNNKIYKSRDIRNSMINPGDLRGSPDVLEVIVFIDNAYLLRLRNYFFKKGLRYSIKKFIEEIAQRTHCQVRKIFFYDAPPFQSNIPVDDEKKKKESYDRFVHFLKQDGIIVREGRTQKLKIGDQFVFRQKGVDMLLGIDMVGVIKEFPTIKNVILLSGDSDFVPVIEKLKNQFMQVILWTYFERERDSPFSKSNELLKSVDLYVKLTKEDFEIAKIR